MEDNFFPTVDVWIRKPHTLHSKIFGAKLQLVGGIVYGRTIIPKLSTKIGKFYESVEHNNSVIKFRSDFLEYVIRLDDAKISARVLDISSTELFDTGWIEKVLPEKLNRLFSQTLHPSPASLELVDIDVYQTLYTHLKCKYSKLLVENWCEKTDAFKFVFEDIGIAAYLMCIWKDPSDVFFVDIGCGNGLLVYLLISEGFRGLGVDIRHRRIWDSYPASVRESLKESTLDAEHNPGFPQANWLIGNHSDELTPWIPVLAARTSHSCKVFVIPCCPFGLFGKYGNFKHSDTQSGISSTDAWVKSEVHKQSHYRAYIEYLKGLFFACWFKPEVDTLRIPSTKRICILGRHLISDEKTDPTLYLERMSAIGRAIEDERRCIKSNSTVFVPRDHDEPVLNCTSLPSEVKLSVGDLIFKAVLDGRPDIELFKSQNLVVSADGKVKTLDGRWWNPGGYLNLNDVATLVPSHHLELMKMQHGGLQTLLRNHHQAFVATRGKVRLRWIPEKMAQCSENVDTKSRSRGTTECTKRKTKPCWMVAHHPDGCPYPPEVCDFIHLTDV